jgi:hypothetical protein
MEHVFLKTNSRTFFVKTISSSVYAFLLPALKLQNDLSQVPDVWFGHFGPL